MNSVSSVIATTGGIALDFLKQEFAERQRRNKHYSLRSFARDLDLHPGTLSSVMTGKRSLPKKSLEDIALRLGLSPKARFLFECSHLKRLAPDQTRHVVENDERAFKLISEWEHFAILSLMNTEDFEPDIAWIASRLGLTTATVDIALKRLVEHGLVVIESPTKWTKTHQVISSSDGVENAALKRAHLSELDLAKERLGEVPLDLRDFSSLTVTCSPERMKLYRDFIRKFLSEFECVAEADKASEVYQLCVQFFPLSTAVPKQVSRPNKRRTPHAH